MVPIFQILQHPQQPQFQRQMGPGGQMIPQRMMQPQQQLNAQQVAAAQQQQQQQQSDPMLRELLG